MDNLIEQMLTIELGYVAIGEIALLWTIGKIPIGNTVPVADNKRYLLPVDRKKGGDVVGPAKKGNEDNAVWDGSAWGNTSTANLANRTVRDSHLWRNVLPVLPCVLGPVAYLTIPMGIDAQWGTKLLMGLFAGLVAAHGRKIIKRIIVDKVGFVKGD